MDGHQYQYDSLNQLTHITGGLPNGIQNIAYEYNQFGNRTKVTKDGVATDYSYDPDTGLLNQIGNTTFSYNGNGSRTVKMIGSEQWNYNYDLKGQLRAISLNDTTVGSYGYDPSGWRVWKEENGKTYLYIRNNDQTIYQEVFNGTVNAYATPQTSRAFVYLGNELVGTVNNGTDARFYINDHLGTTELVTGLNGEIKATVEHSPFGDTATVHTILAQVEKPIGTTSSIDTDIPVQPGATVFQLSAQGTGLANINWTYSADSGSTWLDVIPDRETPLSGNSANITMRATLTPGQGDPPILTSFKVLFMSVTNQSEDYVFTGKEKDATGLYYFGARYYDPEIGQFISEDPGKDGRSWYGYCGNNPIRYVDPDGREVTDYTPTFTPNTTIGAYQPVWYKDWPVIGWINKDIGDVVMLTTGSDQNLITGQCYIGKDLFDSRMGALFTLDTLFMGGLVKQIGTAGYKGGLAGEECLAQIVKGEKIGLKTQITGKWRWIDQFFEGVAHEAKVGKTPLSNFVRNQVLKDVELRETGDIKEIVWHFFRSAVTGEIGPSQELKELLQENGIKIKIHFFNF